MEQNAPSKFDKLLDDAEDYLRTRQELSKLIAIQKSSAAAGGLFSFIVVFLLFFFVFVFASISFAYLITSYTGKAYLGFLVVAFLYLIAGLITFVKRKTLLEKPVMNALISIFLNKEEHE